MTEHLARWARHPAAPWSCWVLAVVALTALAVSRWADLMPVAGDWHDARGLADYRDTIWLPGQYLLAGHNPYDPAAYKAAHPYAQEFNPYAPVWLVLSVVFSLVPYEVSAALYLVFGAGLAALFVAMVVRWAAPAAAPVAVPLVLVWLTLWSPGRYHLQTGGNVLVMIGCFLVLAALARPRQDAGPDGALAQPWWLRPRNALPLGLALAMIKPQFGLPLLLVALIARRGRAVVVGLAGLAVASLPAGLACVLAAGGIGPFLESILRGVSYASGPDSPTGATSAYNARIDVAGTLIRFGAEPSTVLSALVTGILVVGTALVLLRSDRPQGRMLAIATFTLLVIVHQPYDSLLMAVPVLHMLAAGRRPEPAGMVAVLTVLPFSAVVTAVAGLPGRAVADEALGLLLVLVWLLAVGRLLLPSRPVPAAVTS